MIIFKHQVTDWSNLLLECSGHAGQHGESLPCAAASALMAAACEAMQKRNPPRLRITTGDGYCKISCEYNAHTAEIVMTIICGFEWLAEQAPEDVKCERLTNGPKKK